MHNVGKVDVQVSAVYVNHVEQSFNSPYGLKVNANGWLRIAFDWKSGDVYFIDIIINRGTHITSSYKAL